MAAIAYLQRQLIAVVADPLQGDLQLTKTQMGSLMASFFVGYAVFQIPAGTLADRWGTRKSLSLFAMLWSVAWLFPTKRATASTSALRYNQSISLIWMFQVTILMIKKLLQRVFSSGKKTAEKPAADAKSKIRRDDISSAKRISAKTHHIDRKLLSAGERRR